MTLASAILFFAICFASVDPGVMAPSMPQSDSAGGAPSTAQQAPSNQTAPESTKPPSGKPPSQTPAKKPKVGTAKKTSPTKGPPAVTTCDPVPTNGNSTVPSPEPGPQPGSTQEPSTPEPPKNCPPPKKIVRQGGIIEQSIQLAGGSSDEATKKSGEVNRLLKETDDNLKKLVDQKLTGRQLSSAEQSSVSQIHEFVEQSQKATRDGDPERAYTLALKAQILSDDLVNPKK